MFASDATYWHCPGCGFDRKREDYVRRLNVPWDTTGTKLKGRRPALCYYCRQANAFRDTYNKQWDWAAALNKATAMRVASRHPFDGQWGNVTPHLIRVLDIVQEGHCAVTGLDLLKPDNAVFESTRTTLSCWSDKLSINEQGRVPMLVRISPEIRWDSGNVILIATAAESLYHFCGSAVAFRNTIKTAAVQQTTVTAKDVLDRTAEEIFKGQFETWRKLNNERISEEVE
jgi:hypothetical protein